MRPDTVLKRVTQGQARLRRKAWKRARLSYAAVKRGRMSRPLAFDSVEGDERIEKITMRSFDASTLPSEFKSVHTRCRAASFDRAGALDLACCIKLPAEIQDHGRRVILFCKCLIPCGYLIAALHNSATPCRASGDSVSLAACCPAGENSTPAVGLKTRPQAWHKVTTGSPWETATRQESTPVEVLPVLKALRQVGPFEHEARKAAWGQRAFSWLLFS